MTRSRAILALAMPLVLVACGGSSATPTPVPPTAASTSAPTTAPVPASLVPASVAPGGSPAGSPGAEGEPGQHASLLPVPTGVAATTVEMELVDYAFNPSDVSVAAGEITFVLTNNGTQVHEFEIFKGDTVVDEIENLVPSLTADFTVSLPPGSYTFVCKLADHEARGMTGTLTVTG